MLRGDRGLPIFDDLILKLKDTAAIQANQVVVVLVVERRFVPRLIVLKVAFMGDPRLGKEFQGAVNRGRAHAGRLGLHQPQQLFDGNVATGREKGIENHISLPRMF